MSVYSGPEIVNSDMLINFDAGNIKSRFGDNLIKNSTIISSYAPNQNVTISQDGNYIRVKTNQTNSTPGTWPIGGVIPCISNTKYTFRIKAGNYYGTTPNLYVTNQLNTQIIYTPIITSNTIQWNDYTFTSGVSDTGLKVGILWSAPIANSTILIEDAGLHQANLLYDLSGNQINATIAGANTVFTNTNGGEFNFSSNGDIISTSTFTRGTSTTWDVWINCASNDNSYNMFMGAYPPYFGFYTGNRFIFSNLISGAQRTVTTSATRSLNTWYNAVFVAEYDGTNTIMRIYVNGILDATDTFVGVQSSTGLLCFGDGRTFSLPWYRFIGKIAAAKIYNRVLSANEIQQNFQALRGRYGV
jgi:hypothetical protein